MILRVSAHCKATAGHHLLNVAALRYRVDELDGLWVENIFSPLCESPLAVSFCNFAAPSDIPTMQMNRPARSPSLSSQSDDEHHVPREMAPFLRTLRDLLNSECDSIIRWTADGLAFEILDMQSLMTTVLPKYFKHSKYSSFQRQLNYFHFKKWTKSQVNVCTFSNAYFTRDDPLLSLCITRKRSKRETSPEAALMPTKWMADANGTDDELLSSEDLEWLVHFEKVSDSMVKVPLNDEWVLEL
ncbi:Aste57867_981 [Aphanomyces stellatus]|uniref:Aste57867_981 protein n=1 Tax=Aphanomyces stellatus TaxID=120398 RepID=A0A485K942_9STRA|nr:hypothetical protein As57867_000980 [Aphanomyces stellatus]VFT78203.1 Aste57867_981 [Aphanomyces stellatus]